MSEQGRRHLNRLEGQEFTPLSLRELLLVWKCRESLDAQEKEAVAKISSWELYQTINGRNK